MNLFDALILLSIVVSISLTPAVSFFLLSKYIEHYEVKRKRNLIRLQELANIEQEVIRLQELADIENQEIIAEFLYVQQQYEFVRRMNRKMRNKKRKVNWKHGL